MHKTFRCPKHNALGGAPDGQDRLFIHRLYTMSTRKTSKGPKPNPLTQSNRVRKNGEAQFERIQTILNQERSGRQARREFPPEVANKINALSGNERDQRAKEEINALLKKRQKTEKNNTRVGTKRKITPSPTHTDYSTNEGEWEEPTLPKKESFRERVVKEQGHKRNSIIFKLTRNTLGIVHVSGTKRPKNVTRREQKRNPPRNQKSVLWERLKICGRNLWMKIQN